MELLSIMGYDRSGTTFLGSYISSLSKDIFYAGEIDKGIEKFFNNKIKNCSCGDDYLKCAVWSEIFRKMKGPDDLPFLFRELFKRTGARVIVDSSKNFSHIKKCKEIFRNQHLTIHVCREPKGVITSRLKVRNDRIKRGTHPKPEIAGLRIPMMVYDSFAWSLYNIRIAKHKNKGGRNLDLCYDQFEEQLPGKLQNFLVAEIEDLSLIKQRNDHIIWGNKGRKSFDPVIKISENWKNSLSMVEKNMINIMTLPAKLIYIKKH